MGRPPRKGRGVDYIPERQDFVWVIFTPQTGHEQAGHRPALVVSHDLFNQKTGLVFVCPIINSAPRNKFHIPIEGIHELKGSIMADQLKSLDFKARKLTKKGHCPDELFAKILERIEPIIF